MGALDWLQDLIGGGNMPSMNAMGDAGGTGMTPPTPSPAPTMPMPPTQGLDLARPPGADGPAPQPMGTPPVPPIGNQMGDQDGTNTQTGQPPMPPMPPPAPPVNPSADGNPAAGYGGAQMPPQPPVPLPQPRPDGAPGLPPNMPAPPARAPNLPPPAAAAPPAPPTDLSAASRMMPPVPDSGPQAKGIIGRALGLDPNREAQVRGALGAGLKAAGENWNKPGLAAFAGSAGAGIEGGKGADDKTTDQQDRFLGRKLAANTQDLAKAKSGSEATLNLARTQLALAQAKQAMAGGKESVVNSDQQLYLRAQSAAAQDGRLKVLKTAADQAATQFGPDSPQAKAAQKAHKDAYDATVEGHAKALGLDSSKVAKVGKMPGMTADNPIDPKKDKLTQQQLNALPPGTHVMGPDGKVLVKQAPPAPAAGGNQPTSPQQQMTPSVPPLPPVAPVTAPAGSRADQEDED